MEVTARMSYTSQKETTELITHALIWVNICWWKEPQGMADWGRAWVIDNKIRTLPDQQRLNSRGKKSHIHFRDHSDTY